MAGLSQYITDQIIKLGATESLPVIDGHRVTDFPTHRNQARLHEQVKPAISILQLQRGVVFIPDYAGELSAIPRGCGRRLLRCSSGPENRIANFVRRMISRKTCQVSSDELPLASNLVAG